MNNLECLSELAEKDNFGPDNFIYTGVLDEELKKKLSSTFLDAINMFKGACESQVSNEVLLSLLKEQVSRFDRDLLDTEDAENLASNFEKIMDCIGLESSDGILNNWMYDFDPS